MKQQREGTEQERLVGRKEEVRRVLDIVERVQSNVQRGAAVLVTGEAGIGKTEFADHLRRSLKLRGHAILESTCRPRDDRPNGVFIELFARGIQLVSDGGHSAEPLERALDVLSGMVPRTQRANGRPTSDAMFLRETVRRALAQVRAPGVPVVIIRDLHHADETTLNVIAYLFENLLTDPAFDWTSTDYASNPASTDTFRGVVLTTFRETARTQRLVELATASNAIEYLSLSGLNREGVERFLASPKVVDAFMAATSGNPERLSRLVHNLASVAASHSEGQGESLDGSANQVLCAMLALGTYATPRQIGQLVQTTTKLQDLLTTLMDRGLVKRRLIAGRPTFSVTSRAHPQPQQEPLIREYHARLADMMAGAMDAEPESIARHYIAAERFADAVPFALAATDRLKDALAFERAIELLELVVDSTEGALTDEMIDQLAELHAHVGDPTQARIHLSTLIQAQPERAAELNVRITQLLSSQGMLRAALELVDENLRRECQTAERFAFVEIGAEVSYRLGELGRAEAYCRNHLELPEDERSPTADLALRNTLGKVHLFREEFSVAQDLFEQNLALAQSSQNEGQQAKALINLGVVHLQQGAPDVALQHFEKARELAESNGDIANLSIAVENLAVLYHRRQAFRDALAFYHLSTVTSRRMGRHLQLTTSALNLADLYLTVGDIDRAHRLADIANEYIESHQLRFLRAQQTTLAGDIARALGHLDRAQNRYAEAIEHLQRGEQTNQRLAPLLWATAELNLELGQLDRAEALLNQAFGLASMTSASLAVKLRMTKGAIHAARDEMSAAQLELEAAANGAVESEDREAVWRVRFRLAQVYWKQGDTDAAQRLLARALEVIERVAAELPPGLRRFYREAPARQTVREGLRRLRAGMPLAPEPLEETATSHRAPPGEYRPLWQQRYPKIIGRSPALFPVFKALDRVSGSDSMVLIRGESGTGKELVASALHEHSKRRSGPFVKVNCAAFVESLLLSELFGHEKGAFTGATSTKKGRFELADGGTLFLDEIGDISNNTQVALLRVLQEKSFERVGGQETLTVNVRVICATHRHLEDMVKAGTFRADLYYRLRGVMIDLPALRDRPTDIPRLVKHFLKRQNVDRATSLAFDRDALASLFQHDWPGNIRELENVVRSAILFADGDTVSLRELAQLGDILPFPTDAAIIALTDLLEANEADDDPSAAAKAGTHGEPEMTQPQAVSASNDDVQASIQMGQWLDEAIVEAGGLAELKKKIEFEAISSALNREKGNITRAAKRLGIKRPRLSQIIHGNIELAELKDKLTDTE